MHVLRFIWKHICEREKYDRNLLDEFVVYTCDIVHYLDKSLHKY